MCVKFIDNLENVNDDIDLTRPPSMAGDLTIAKCPAENSSIEPEIYDERESNRRKK